MLPLLSCHFLQVKLEHRQQILAQQAAQAAQQAAQRAAQRAAQWAAQEAQTKTRIDNLAADLHRVTRECVTAKAGLGGANAEIGRLKRWIEVRSGSMGVTTPGTLPPEQGYVGNAFALCVSAVLLLSSVRPSVCRLIGSSVASSRPLPFLFSGFALYAVCSQKYIRFY